MRHLLPLFALLAGACVTPAGQKITVLLSFVELPCETEGDRTVARLPLTRDDDLYQATLIRADDVAITLASERSGLEAVFECPEGVSTITVRHAPILQATREGGGGTTDSGGSNPPPGGSNPPPGG